MKRTQISRVGKKNPKCAVCKKTYKPSKIGQKVCGYACAIEHAKREQVKRAVKPYQPVYRKHAVRANSLSHQLELTQEVFNNWIRWRDRHQLCISSGRPNAQSWDAGHYRPIGGMGGSILRFDEMNVHKQSSEDNQHRGGNLTHYRIGLIARIGIEEVERLESVRGTKKWDIDELKEIRRVYSKRLRDEQRSDIPDLDQSTNYSVEPET